MKYHFYCSHIYGLICALYTKNTNILPVVEFIHTHNTQPFYGSVEFVMTVVEFIIVCICVHFVCKILHTGYINVVTSYNT